MLRGRKGDSWDAHKHQYPGFHPGVDAVILGFVSCAYVPWVLKEIIKSGIKINTDHFRSTTNVFIINSFYNSSQLSVVGSTQYSYNKSIFILLQHKDYKSLNITLNKIFSGKQQIMSTKIVNLPRKGLINGIRLWNLMRYW